jgi:hypothetical protein
MTKTKKMRRKKQKNSLDSTTANEDNPFPLLVVKEVMEGPTTGRREEKKKKHEINYRQTLEKKKKKHTRCFRHHKGPSQHQEQSSRCH